MPKGPANATRAALPSRSQRKRAGAPSTSAANIHSSHEIVAVETSTIAAPVPQMKEIRWQKPESTEAAPIAETLYSENDTVRHVTDVPATPDDDHVFDAPHYDFAHYDVPLLQQPEIQIAPPAADSGGGLFARAKNLDLPELGRQLRDTREAKGVSLLEAQQATKIRLPFLEALENEDYATLPPPVFVRGFIKNYAVFLGLNPAELIRKFEIILDHASQLGEPDEPPRRSNKPITNVAAVLGYEPPKQHDGRLLPKTETPAESAVRRLGGLRPSKKYTLQPALRPIERNAIYFPNMLPLLIIIGIVIAVLLLAFTFFANRDDKTVDVQAATATIQSRYPTPTNIVYPTQNPKAPYIPAPVITEGAGNITIPAQNPNAALSNNVVPDAIAKLTPTLPPPTATPQPTATPVPTATPPPPMDVVITANERAWISLSFDGQKVPDFLLDVGESRAFKVTKSISIFSGKPGSTAIKINGQDKSFTGGKSGMITHTYNVDGSDKIE